MWVYRRASFDGVAGDDGGNELWHNAFGINGLSLGKLTVEISLELKTAPLPIPGIALEAEIMVRVLGQWGRISIIDATQVTPMPPQ